MYVKYELETRLTEFPNLGIDGPDAADAPVKIALITCAFDNSKIIGWLRQRGKYIKTESWDNLDKVNNTIR